jgi:hypothetical protein
MSSYARDGWPDATPGYAILGYPRLLTGTDPARLSALARDARRHEYLRRATGSDHAALTEIQATLQVIADQNLPDLKAMVELAARWNVLSNRNGYVTSELAVAWAMLGDFGHAQALAASIPDPPPGDSPVALVALTAAEAGYYDLAESIARADPRHPDDALAGVARAVSVSGDHDRAESIAGTITRPAARARALAMLAEVAARAGHYDHAVRLLRAIDPD